VRVADPAIRPGIRRKSLTFRLTLLFAAASTAVLLILGLIVARSVERHFEEQDMQTLGGKLELIRHALAKVHSSTELAGIAQQMDDALIGHHGLVVAVLGPDGQTLFATDDAPFPRPLLDRAGTADGQRPYVWRADGHAYFRGIVAAVPTGIQDWPPAVVAVATDISHHRGFMDAFMKTLWLVVTGGTLATGLLGWFAARRGLAPLREMKRRAAEVSAQHLDQRLPADAVPVELAELVDSLNDMLARLEESFKRLSDFSSDLAHELRTPVSNLMTQTQVALSRSRTADAYRDVLESNAEEFERLSRMISDMLFLAKSDNGLIVPGHERFDLADEVRTLFDFYGALAEDKGVALKLEGAGAVTGDRLMLRRAVSNLLSNALRYTAPGGEIVVSISTSAGADGRDTVRLAVGNTGEPIPPEHLPRLFDRFYRVDAARHHGSDGAGLGLAITRSILRAHGGDVEGRGAPGRNIFEMRLPAPAATRDGAASPPSRVPPLP